MNVEFAEPGTEADDHIEILISNHSASDNCCWFRVITVCAGCQTDVMDARIDSEEFLRVYYPA